MWRSDIKIKNQIIEALKSDGFQVVDKKDFVVATKQENILYIRSLEDIHTELNLKYLAEKSTLKEIGGVDVNELKKLIKEASNRLIPDILGFVTTKLNWAVNYTDSFELNNKTIEFTELRTDTDEIITLVFLNPDRLDHFFSLEMNYRKFLRLVDTLQYKDLQSYAPTFYRLVNSSV